MLHGTLSMRTETHVFNDFFANIVEKLIQSVFKITEAVPVFKNGDRSVLGNYRRISMVPVISKIFEVLLKNHLE